MKLRINFWVGIYFILGLFYIPPAIISLWPKLDTVNSILNYTSEILSLIMICIFFIKKSKINVWQITIVLTLGWLLLCDLFCNDFSAFRSLLLNSLHLLGYIIIISMTYSKGRESAYLSGTSAYCAMICILNIVTQLCFQDGIYYVWDKSWQPFFLCGNANSFVFFYIFSIGILVQNDIQKKGRIRLLTIIMNGITLASNIIGGTTTGTVILLLYFIFLLIQNNTFINFVTHYYKQLLLIASIIAVWFFVLDGWSSKGIIKLVQNLFNEDISYYQRGAIWLSAVSNIAGSPLVGYGTGTANLNADLDGILRSAHNSFLQVALYGGLIALTLYVSIIYISVRKIKNIHNNRVYFAFLTIVLYLIAFMFEQNPLYIGYISSLLILYNDTRVIKTRKKKEGKCLR